MVKDGTRRKNALSCLSMGLVESFREGFIDFPIKIDEKERLWDFLISYLVR